jgi:radical SAM superfamily enzyme YgiQ (UPF0313 family)
MKITLISPFYDVTAVGIRILSSCLKKAGHDTQMIFLTHVRGGYLNDFLVHESDGTVKKLAELCSDSDLIGISLMTNYFFRVASLTTRLKQHILKPIVWGGVHPTIRPEECLDYADMVCVSEGEDAIVELCNRMERGEEYQDINGIWSRGNGTIKKNNPRCLIQDLDIIPFPDYSIKDSYILDNDSIFPMDKERLHQAMLRGMTIDDGKATYQIITSRGCPLDCSYCCNDIFKRIHKKDKYLRSRSVENIIAELDHATQAMNYIEGIWISDDCFIYGSLEYLRKFVSLYKQKIGLPFFCLGDPLHITREKMELLCEGGMRLMTMGIQSGSENAKRLYKRKISNDRIIQATKIINEFTDRMKFPMYDVIVDNPYESREDEYETIKLVSRIPKPYYLQLFSLTLFPETSLYKRAREDGIITDDYEQIYKKPYYKRCASYHNILLRLYNRDLPDVLMKILSSRACYFFFSMRFFSGIYSAFVGIMDLNRRIRAKVSG